MNTKTKRMQHQPIRSPTPDMANRNIIKDTKISTQDIKRYLEKSRSPRLSEISQNKSKVTHHEGNLNQIIQSLYQKIYKLETENMRLCQDNQVLRQTIAKNRGTNFTSTQANADSAFRNIDLAKYEHRQVSSLETTQPEPNHNLITLKNKLTDFANQNNRLMTLLANKNEQINEIKSKSNSDISSLRNQIDILRRNNMVSQSQQPRSTRTLSTDHNHDNSQYEIRRIQNFYETQIRQKMEQHQAEWNHNLQSYQRKIDKCERELKYMHSNLSSGVRPTVKSHLKAGMSTPDTMGFSNKTERIGYQFDTSPSRNQNTKENEQLRNKCRDLQNDCERLRNRNNDIQSECEQLRNRYNDAQQQNLQLRNRRNDLQNESEQLRNRSNDLEHECEQLRNRRNVLSKECEQLRSRCNDAQYSNQQLKIRCRSLQQQKQLFSIMQNQNKQLKSRCDNLQQSSQQLRNKRNDVQLECEELRNRCNGLQNINQLLNNAQQQSKQLRNRCNDLQQQNELLRSRSNNFQHQNQQLDLLQQSRNRCNDLQQQNEQLRSRCNNMQQQIAKISISSDMQHEIKLLNKVQQENIQLINRCNELQHTNEQLIKRCNELEYKNEQVGHRRNDVQTESKLLNNLQQQNQQLTHKCNDLQQSNKKLRNKYNDMQQQNRQLRNRNKDNQSIQGLNNLQQENVQLTGICKDLQQQNQQLNSKYNNIRQLIETKNAQISSLQNELQNVLTSLQNKDSLVRQMQRDRQDGSVQNCQNCQFIQKQLQLSKVQQSNLRNRINELELAQEKASKKFHIYLDLLNEIRRDIETSDVQESFEVSGEIEHLGLDEKINKLQEQSAKMINDLRAQLEYKEQSVIELQKANRILSAEIDNINEQKERLRKSMLENEDLWKNGIQATSNISQSVKHRESQNCRLKSCLRGTVSKINNLEAQIVAMLNEE